MRNTLLPRILSQVLLSALYWNTIYGPGEASRDDKRVCTSLQSVGLMKKLLVIDGKWRYSEKDLVLNIVNYLANFNSMFSEESPREFV